MLSVILYPRVVFLRGQCGHRKGRRRAAIARRLAAPSVFETPRPRTHGDPTARTPVNAAGYNSNAPMLLPLPYFSPSLSPPTRSVVERKQNSNQSDTQLVVRLSYFVTFVCARACARSFSSASFYFVHFTPYNSSFYTVYLTFFLTNRFLKKYYPCLMHAVASYVRVLPGVSFVYSRCARVRVSIPAVPKTPCRDRLHDVLSTLPVVYRIFLNHHQKTARK